MLQKGTQITSLWDYAGVSELKFYINEDQEFWDTFSSEYNFTVIIIMCGRQKYPNPFIEDIGNRLINLFGNKFNFMTANLK